MDFFNILENIIATIIATFLIAFMTLLLKYLSSKYKEDKLKFIINLSFYFDLFYTLAVCLINDIKDLFSSFSYANIFCIFCIILDIFFTVMAYEKMKSYTYRSAKNSENNIN